MRARWMPEYVISEESQRLLDEAASLRTLDAVSERREDRYPLGGHSQRVRFDQNGFAAEAVVRHHFDIEPMPRVAPYRHGSADMVLGTKRLDVKCTEHRHGVLQRHKRGSSNADAYILVLRNGLRYTISGWLPAKDLMRDENQGTGRWAQAWIARQEQLRCITFLRAWCLGDAA